MVTYSRRTTPWVCLQEWIKCNFHSCIAPWPLIKSTHFLHYNRRPPRARYTANFVEFASTTREIWLLKMSCILLRFFLPLSNNKNCSNSQTRTLIRWKFGKLEEHSKANSSTKFDANVIRTQRVISDHSWLFAYKQIYLFTSLHGKLLDWTSCKSVLS